MVSRDSKLDSFANSPILLIFIKSGLLAGIRWSVCMLKSHRSLCESFSTTGAGLCIYHLLVWLNLHFLHISQWITLPTQPFLALYSLCANLLHSLIMWLMISSLSPHSLHLLFCWVLSILALIWLVLTALSCAAIRRDSVSLLLLLSLFNKNCYSKPYDYKIKFWHQYKIIQEWWRLKSTSQKQPFLLVEWRESVECTAVCNYLMLQFVYF